MSMSMPDMGMSVPDIPMPNGLGGSTDTNTDTDTDVDTTAPTSLSPSISPSSAPSSTSTLELVGNSDAVIISGLEGEGDSSASNPSRIVTPGHTVVIAIISLAVCATLAIGLLVLRRHTLAARASSASGSISSGFEVVSQGSLSSLSDGA